MLKSLGRDGVVVETVLPHENATFSIWITMILMTDVCDEMCDDKSEMLVTDSIYI